ncbi:carboxymuconolactone decarboxylase family protein [Brevibacillus fluminis]|uniref:carboxymuconolactone decarboxylase family protein n=1 Tax=Brevibacillus fluminis TaxID=511487 RepID=UPI003F8C286B
MSQKKSLSFTYNQASEQIVLLLKNDKELIDVKPYYDPANLQRIPELMKLSPDAAAAFLHYEHQVYQTAQALPERTKELIAITVAHVTGCPYCIDVHVKKFKGLGGTVEEIMEALLVAASTRAGAILSHGVNALLAFEEGEGKNPEKSAGKSQNGPECFC